MPIKILDPLLIQRIAAGEVIEDSSSVLRELLDNSIDSKSTEIDIYIEEGGLENITIIDNGKGFSKEDLLLSCSRHATSKISKLDDLYNIRTLGFRGEALYSISSCALLSIDSNGFKKTINNGREIEFSPSSTNKQTIIRVDKLFNELPARKQFLKRSSTLAKYCKKVFLEKAAPFAEIKFRFFNDGKLIYNFPTSESKERIIKILSLDKNFLSPDAVEYNATRKNFKLYAVGSYSSFRYDRNGINIFVNNHCIDDYSLVKSITNGYGELLPGGRYPYFTLFVDINPELVDFNIHPTKRECRIRNKNEVFGTISNMISSQTLRIIPNLNKPIQNELKIEPISEDQKQINWENYLSNDTKKSVPFNKATFSSEVKENTSWDDGWLEKAKETLKEKTEFKPPIQKNYKYLGQVFKLFLVIEMENKIIFIDQHAAHERILFDEFVKNQNSQKLLIPYEFEVEEETDQFLLENSYIYNDYAIELTRPKPLTWEIDTIPALSKGLQEKIANFISKTSSIQEIEKDIFAILACHAAIKQGDDIDKTSALELIDKVLLLKEKCCPHGRTFISELSYEDLISSVGRF